MHAALAIAGKDLRQRFRDRSAIVLGFIAPVGIAALMSTALSGANEFHFSLGVVNDDGGPIAGALLDVLESPELSDIVTVESIPTADDARRQVDDGDVAVALVVPAGFSDAAVALDPASAASVQLLVNADDALAAEVAAAIADGFLAQVNASRLSVLTAITAGAPVDRLGELASAAAEDRLPIEISQRSVGSEPLDPISYYAPSMGMFFVLFSVGFASRSFFTERAQGTLERMAVAPVARRSILAGKALSVLSYAVASMTAMALVTGIVFGADWGHPLAAAALIVAVGLAVVALTALVIALSRTDRQADAMSSVVVFTLAILGGSFIQASELPPLMRTFALATPNGWALRGFVDLGTTTGGAGHDLRLVAGPTLGILAFTAVAGALATVASRRVAS